jgi:Tfp pilus assembly protein FimV
MVTIPYWFIRYGLPAGFLLLATIAILAARHAIHAADAEPSVRPQAPVRATVRPRRKDVRGIRASSYSVRSGDTLGSIAERLGTTVDRLLELNPGIDPRVLRVGQTVRVK